MRADDHAVSQAAIAAEAGIDKVTTSTVVRALESKGLVDRLRNENSLSESFALFTWSLDNFRDGSIQRI